MAAISSPYSLLTSNCHSLAFIVSASVHIVTLQLKRESLLLGRLWHSKQLISVTTIAHAKEECLLLEAVTKQLSEDP
jgi:hypothetical protein